MNKTYRFYIHTFYFPKVDNKKFKEYNHVTDFWKSLGGTTSHDHYGDLYGTDTILTEFILTYPYSQYVNITEIPKNEI